MNQADYFRNPWWDMYDTHQQEQGEKRRTLAREQLEVRDEMMMQEYFAGKRQREIAQEFGLHYVTVCNAIKRARERI